MAKNQENQGRKAQLENKEFDGWYIFEIFFLIIILHSSSSNFFYKVASQF